MLIARPIACGLTIAGASGVCAVIDNLLAELGLTLGPCGVTAPAGLTRDKLTAVHG